MGCSIIRQRTAKSKNIEKRESICTNFSLTPGTFSRVVRNKNIKNYSPVFTLGEGAFSEAILCVNSLSSQQRVLKVVKKSSLVSQQLDNFYKLQEISILRKLDHPNIIKCFEVFEDENNYYLPTEYCRGGDLFRRLKRTESFSEKHISEIMFQVISALAHCHEKKIAHRDIKPENIFLEDEEGFDLKIGDFGSSCMLDEDGKASDVFGSPYYIAPEMFTGRYHEKIDMWSCGILMYCLLTQKAPYPGNNPELIKKQIRIAPFRLSPKMCGNFSEEITDLMQKLLEIDPDKRLSAKDALKHPFISNYRLHNIYNSLLTLSNNCVIHQCKLKKAVCMYIINFLISPSDLKISKKIFQMLDINGDGKIDITEIELQLLKENTYIEEIPLLSKRIIELMDLNSNSTIEYSEFLLAFIDCNTYLIEENILQAFKVFDEDQDGFLNLKDIEKINGTPLDLRCCKEFFGNSNAIDSDAFVKFIQRTIIV